MACHSSFRVFRKLLEGAKLPNSNSRQKLHSPASEEVITKLKIYFELFFEKSDPNAFFSMFYSMLNCGNYRTGDSLEAIGVLTPVRSYFNISRRTAFFISSMTQLIDSIDNKPPGFLQARNTPHLISPSLSFTFRKRYRLQEGFCG